MPTFTSSRVTVTSQTLRTALSLDDMRALLVEQRPAPETRTPGWAAMHDETTQLGQFGTVGVGHVVIEPGYDDIPERLSARYFYWVYNPQDDSGQDDERNWRLDAVDVQISANAGNYLVLLSTADETLILPTSGSVTRSLVGLLQEGDEDLSLTSGSSLNFQTTDVYLWLAHQLDKKTELVDGTFVKEVAAINAEEDKVLSRGATLRGRVDMQRTTFLNAIAEGSALGPAVVTISALNADGHTERVSARIWEDGWFTLMLSRSNFRNLADADAIRLEAVYRFAYRYVPLINKLYKLDEDWKQIDRDWLVISKRVELADHYKHLAESHPRWDEYQASQAKSTSAADQVTH